MEGWRHGRLAIIASWEIHHRVSWTWTMLHKYGKFLIKLVHARMNVSMFSTTLCSHFSFLPVRPY